MARNLLSADKVHEHVQSGTALLVCAYDSDEKFHKFHLEGAISLNEFKKKCGAISKDQEIVFYCA